MYVYLSRMYVLYILCLPYIAYTNYISYLICHILCMKAAGKYRQEGRNYVMQDGDIVHFMFNVTATGKKK